MTVSLIVNGKKVDLIEYYGWSEPGRTPEIDWLNRRNKKKPPLTTQLLEISEYLDYITKNRKIFKGRELEELLGYSESAWRQIRPLMDKLGLLTTKIRENKKIDTDQPISKKGLAYNKATKRRLEDDSNYKELMEFQRQLWGMIVMSYQAEKPEGLYPIRAIIRTLNRNQYLDKIEWDIMTTFITNNDDSFQESTVDAFINEYRRNPQLFASIKKVVATKKGPKTGRLAHELNRNTYSKNLGESGLIIITNEFINGKSTSVIKLNNKNKKLIDLIISDDFYKELSRGGAV